MPYRETASGRLWYAERKADASDRPPLVLIHGAGGSHLDWPAELRRLPGWRVLALDLPAHGRSGGVARNRVSEYAADVASLLEALSSGPVVVCGHSMGGAIAQILGLYYPSHIAGLILLATGAKLRVPPDIVAGVRTNPDTTFAAITRNMWVEGTPQEVLDLGIRRFQAAGPAVVYADLMACNDFDTMALLPQISVPTLVIGGTEDRMTPHKFSVFLAESIPQASFVTIDGGGHMMALEQPAAVQRAIQDWLKQEYGTG